MYESCKSVSAGVCYVSIVLVVSLVLYGEAVAHVRIPCVLVYVVATMTLTNVHLYSITLTLDVLIQFCSNCTLRRHPNLCAV